jgi:hypothetical protein
MQKIIFYLKNHLQEHTRQGKSGIIFLLLFPTFIFSCVGLRYVLDIDIYFPYSYNSLVFKALYYNFPFFTTIFLCTIFLGKKDFLHKKEFWLLSFSIVGILSLSQYTSIFSTQGFDANTHYFLKKLFFNIECCLLYMILPIVYWFLWHQKTNPEWHFYGFTTKNFYIKPYLIMLAMMMPLLYWASLRPDFLSMYPRYKAGMAEYYWQIPTYFTIATYELSYSLQFVCLELFFRGFIVLSLSKYLGSSSVWVMVAVYVFIHFGKPLPETVGSFFGGYILGVIAYYSKTVFGGIWIHIGVALGMELFAYWQS